MVNNNNAPNIPGSSLRQQYLSSANLWDDILPEQDTPDTVAGRQNVAPPPQPEKNEKYNKYGFVDIITFCTHPYYLNLKLYPWQILTLKGFYAGQYGNFHLNIDNTRSETGCDGCVWKSNMQSEMEHVAQLRQKKLGVNLLVKDPKMSAGNSPCLECERFDNDARDLRYERLIDVSSTEKAETDIRLLSERILKDKYENERDLLDDPLLNTKVRDQFINKVEAKQLFSELIMVMGRRSGKSYMVSVIALYEAYKLLAMGHPQLEYPIQSQDDICIFNVAVSESTARMAIFAKIVEMATPSPFFSQYIGKQTLTELHFLTPYDIEENKRRIASGAANTALNTGTIQLISGHSNSKALLGRTAIVIIIDEMAAMARETTEDGADSSLYSLMKPSLATFGENGKIICLSNPMGDIGYFYELYKISFDEPNMLMLQLPTQLSNPNVDRKFLADNLRRNPRDYAMQFGAEFGSAGVDPFLPGETVEDAFYLRAKDRRTEVGAPFVRYFAHLDPAGTGSDNYALVIVHTEPITQAYRPGELPQFRVVVDHIHVWEPRGRNHPINVEEVDSYIIGLASKFKFVQVSYDQWNSQGAITKLKNHGINAIMTPFSMHYQDLIFTELYDLFISERISLYGVDTKIMVDGIERNLQDASQAKSELLSIQKKWRGKHFKVEAAAGKRDDIVDCIASAAYQALKTRAYNSLPKAHAVRLSDRFR